MIYCLMIVLHDMLFGVMSTELDRCWQVIWVERMLTSVGCM